MVSIFILSTILYHVLSNHPCSSFVINSSLFPRCPQVKQKRVLSFSRALVTFAPHLGHCGKFLGIGYLLYFTLCCHTHPNKWFWRDCCGINPASFRPIPCPPYRLPPWGIALRLATPLWDCPVYRAQVVIPTMPRMASSAFVSIPNYWFCPHFLSPFSTLPTDQG